MREVLLFSLLLLPRKAEGFTRTEKVSTTYGDIRGFVVRPQVAGLNDVDVYLGIPYGELNQNRFVMPREASKWTNSIKDAVSPPPACMQNGPGVSGSTGRMASNRMPPLRYNHLHRLEKLLSPESEDCLYLNIYVPQRPGYAPKPLLPILVLLHGESYEWNSGNPYNGTILAASGQIIVVTVNYRLGVFGTVYVLSKCNIKGT